MFRYLASPRRCAIILASLLIGLLLAADLPPLAAKRAAPEGFPIEPLPPGVVIETVVPGVNNLVAMDFTPDGRLLYTERFSSNHDGSDYGYVRVVVNGQLQPNFVYEFPVMTQAERGLLGIAVDPNFASNHYVWVYHTKQTADTSCGNYQNRVVRFTLNDDNAGSDTQFAGCYPVNYWETIHNGGNLHFGPDGKLYVTVGNNDSKNDGVDPAQNLSSPLGKIHRYNPTVKLSVPSDNPFPGNSIYAYGLRNSFDFDFDPVTGRLFATENGDDSDDEINLILPGYDYGWRPNYPPYPGDDGNPGGPDPRYNTIPPLIYWSPTIAPTGLTFYRGDLIPEWKNDLFMCAYKDESAGVHHFKLDASRTHIISHTVISGTWCRTDLLTGPDGALYYSQEGGYSYGPIMRISRTTSFTPSSVSVNPIAVRTGDVFTYTIRVSHVGTLSNTFEMVATLSPQTTLKSLSAGLSESAGQIYWSGTVTGIQSLTGTIAVTVTDPLTTPYLITIPIDIDALNLPAVNLSATTWVNAYPVFLPLIRR